MPVYLLYGFKWPRRCVRYHVVLENIDDAAPEWIVAPRTTQALLNDFQNKWPDLIEALPNLRFIEQYDALEETVSQPFAYVAIFVHDIKLGADITEVVKNANITRSQHNAFAKLKENMCVWSLAPVELGWYVVVCGDEERSFPQLEPVPPSTTTTLLGSSPLEKKNSTSTDYTGSTETNSIPGQAGPPHFLVKEQRNGSFSRGIRRVFGKKELVKSKSLKDLRADSRQSSDPIPPLPPPTAR